MNGGVVLVADDESNILQVVRQTLKNSGFETIDTSNGREAVEAFKREQRRIGAVLLDLTMPVMGGAEAFHLIKGISPTIPVLLMSGYTEQEIDTHFTDQKPDGFLQKPFRPDALQAKLQELFSSSRPTAA